MTGFLGEIGQKLADRWAALLAIPGLLYLAAVTVAAVLGQEHALSYPDLSRKITAWADSPVLKSAGGAVLIVGAILAGSVVAGLLHPARRQVSGGKLAPRGKSIRVMGTEDALEVGQGLLEQGDRLIQSARR